MISASSFSRSPTAKTVGLRAALAALIGLSVGVAAAPASAKYTKRHAASSERVADGASLEARHEKCLSFIRAHGLSCDPWKEPLCGYEAIVGNLGVARPLECVAP